LKIIFEIFYQHHLASIKTKKQTVETGCFLESKGKIY